VSFIRERAALRLPASFSGKEGGREAELSTLKIREKLAEKPRNKSPGRKPKEKRKGKREEEQKGNGT